MDGQVNGWIGEWMDGEGVDAQAGCARRAGRVGNACRHVLRECAAASTLARPPLVPACLPACLSPRLSSRARSIPPCGTSGSSPARPCLCVPNLSVCPPPLCLPSDLLGSSLWDIWNQEGQQLTAQYVACVAVEALNILEALHQKG